MPQLQRAVVQGRAYVGVGSEQNFTYIAAARPSLAFIVDIRRGNFDLHLLYKALFEMSADRAEFVSRLFSRPRPAGLGPSSTAAAIFAAYERATPSQALYTENLAAIDALLTAEARLSAVARRSPRHRVRLQRLVHARAGHPLRADQRRLRSAAAAAPAASRPMPT